MDFDLTEYAAANRRDSLPSIAASLVLLVGGVVVAFVRLDQLLSSGSETDLLVTLLGIAMIGGGTFTLLSLRLSLALRGAAVTNEGLRLRLAGGGQVSRQWKQRGFVLRIFDLSRTRRFADVAPGDWRWLLRYRLAYSTGGLFISSPISEGVLNEIFSASRASGLDVRELTMRGGPQAKRVQYVIRAR